MKIRTDFVTDRNLENAQNRMRERAKAHGLSYEQALYSAIMTWLEGDGEWEPGLVMTLPESAGIPLVRFIEACQRGEVDLTGTMLDKAKQSAGT